MKSVQKIPPEPCPSCCSPDSPVGGRPLQTVFPMQRDVPRDDVCCGPPAGPASSPFERAGFTLCRFVTGFVETASGPVPRVGDALEAGDLWGALKVRIGVRRNRYRTAPGLYCVGAAGPESPVLVTANYKLSFDVVRNALKNRAAWVLVLDTRGINVWCAAGKKTFSTEEVVRQVVRARLDRVVSHRKLILPQLGATGVSAGEVKKRCGFEVLWGPVRAADIPAFLDAGMKADAGMRRVTFSLRERMTLVPVELTELRKYLLWVLPLLFVLSGVGREVFSWGQAWQRGLAALAAVAAGVAAGAVVVPLLLPWIPGRAFSVKGLLAGVVPAAAVAAGFGDTLGATGAAAAVLLTLGLSSYLAMNFTGATPFTSPSGVEKEMRRAIPGQAAAAAVALILWVWSAFV